MTETNEQETGREHFEKDIATLKNHPLSAPVAQAFNPLLRPLVEGNASATTSYAGVTDFLDRMANAITQDEIGETPILASYPLIGNLPLSPNGEYQLDPATTPALQGELDFRQQTLDILFPAQSHQTQLALLTPHVADTLRAHADLISQTSIASLLAHRTAIPHLYLAQAATQDGKVTEFLFFWTGLQQVRPPYDQPLSATLASSSPSSRN